MIFEQGKTISDLHHFTTSDQDSFDNIRGVFGKCFSNQGESVIAYPTKLNEDKKKIPSPNNKAFDFLIAKCTSPKRLKVRSFDFGVSKIKSEI